MRDFPGFMKNEKNRVPQGVQNTEDIEGYFYEGPGGGQMAFWTCNSERESKKHKHDFDEYMVIVSGQYTACFEDREIVLNREMSSLSRRGQSSGADVLPEQGRSMHLGEREFNPNNVHLSKKTCGFEKGLFTGFLSFFPQRRSPAIPGNPGSTPHINISA